MSHKVFVYGTLKDCDVNDSFQVQGELYDLGAFPGIKLVGDKFISGQILNVTNEELENLDKYEGVPRLYSRKKVIASPIEAPEFEKDEFIEAWVYEYNGDINRFHQIDTWITQWI